MSREQCLQSRGGSKLKRFRKFFTGSLRGSDLMKYMLTTSTCCLDQLMSEVVIMSSLEKKVDDVESFENFQMWYYLPHKDT